MQNMPQLTPCALYLLVLQYWASICPELTVTDNGAAGSSAAKAAGVEQEVSIINSLPVWFLFLLLH